MKKYISCILICLSLLLFGCESKEKLMVQTNTVLEYKDLPPILVKGEFEKEEIDIFVKKNISKQPDYLIKNVKKIIVCDDEEYEKFPISKTSFAFSNPNDLSIYTRGDVEFSTITHELVHILDYMEGYHYLSSSAKFITLYNQYKNTFHFVNDKKNQYSKKELKKYDAYFNASSDEFFAGVGELYINHNSYLKKECEEIYLYLSKFLIN